MMSKEFNKILKVFVLKGRDDLGECECVVIADSWRRALEIAENNGGRWHIDEIVDLSEEQLLIFGRHN